MQTLHVWPESPQTSGTEVTLRAIYEGFDSGKKNIEIVVPQPVLACPPARHDHFALAALFPAMAFFDTCVVHGEVSRPMLANLCELNVMWAAWHPKRYHQVEWLADQVVEKPAALGPRSGYLLAFSGGVDSALTLQRHAGGDLGWRKLPIAAAFMIHGFDLPLANPGGFQKAREKAGWITARTGVPLFTVRTNLRELPPHWEDAIITNLAALQHVFNETFAGAMFAADEPYAYPYLPWNSNPVSNPFLATPLFPIRTDGAELHRLESIRQLSKWAEAIDNLRVCWAGGTPGENCGACEKCVRTQLELDALGLGGRASFTKKLAPGMILAIRPWRNNRLEDYTELLDYAERNKLSFWWTREVQKMVWREENSATVRFQALRRTFLGLWLRKMKRTLTRPKT